LIESNINYKNNKNNTLSKKNINFLTNFYIYILRLNQHKINNNNKKKS
jgi:hypothetical protein